MNFNTTIHKSIILVVFSVILTSCNKNYIDKRLVGDWEIMNIYHNKSNIETLKDENSDFIFMDDFMTVGRFGNFMLVLLSMDKEVKGRFDQNNLKSNYILIEEINDEKYKGLYEYSLTKKENIFYLKMESNNIIIYARKNPVILNP